MSNSGGVAFAALEPTNLFPTSVLSSSISTSYAVLNAKIHPDIKHEPMPAPPSRVIATLLAANLVPINDMSNGVPPIAAPGSDV